MRRFGKFGSNGCSMKVEQRIVEDIANESSDGSK
jgi:hypothetical protein